MGIGKVVVQPDRTLGVSCNGLASHPWEEATLLVTSFFRKLGVVSQLGKGDKHNFLTCINM